MTPNEFEQRVDQIRQSLESEGAENIRLLRLCRGCDANDLGSFGPEDSLHKLPEPGCLHPDEHHVYEPYGVEVEYTYILVPDH